MKSWFCLLCFFAVAVACNNNAANKEETVDTSKSTVASAEENKKSTGDEARTSLDWAGTYKGILLCADCEGIETELMLHSDNTYMLSTTYLGKKEAAGEKTNGRWKWLDGYNIELEAVKDGPSKYFVTEGRIIQLDREGKRIEGALAEKYVLGKIK